jgi:predicted ester cyclase
MYDLTIDDCPPDHLPPHTPLLPREGFRQRLARFRAAFADLQHTLEDLVAEGDRVVIHVTIRGTHHGIFHGIAPTGAAVTLVNTASIMGLVGLVPHPIMRASMGWLA